MGCGSLWRKARGAFTPLTDALTTHAALTTTLGGRTGRLAEAAAANDLSLYTRRVRPHYARPSHGRTLLICCTLQHCNALLWCTLLWCTLL